MNTILVVEDNPQIAAALMVRLRAAGYCLLYTSPSPRDS